MTAPRPIRRFRRGVAAFRRYLLVVIEMNIYLILLLSISVIAVLLRMKVPIGPAILSAGLMMWPCADRTLSTLFTSACGTLAAYGTYDLILALYFVMCLEVLLRKSGTLSGMVNALNRLFSSARATIAIMPAFLGLLPSIGGALFFAPIVETGSGKMPISAERKAAVNYFFRHIFETSSPTIPGMLLACAIAGIRLSDLVIHLFWFSLLAFIVGWLILLSPLRKDDHVNKAEEHCVSRWWDLGNVLLAVSPVFLNILVMMLFGWPAAAAMGAAVLILIPVLRLLGRGVPLRDVFLGALDLKLLMNVSCILYFIALLTDTGVLKASTDALQALPLAACASFAILAFFMGLLTGMTQAFIAIVMPIAGSLAPGSLEYAGIAMVFGCAGQMLTPVHLCFTISVSYFKANFFQVWKLMFWCEAILCAVYATWLWLTWN